MSTAAAATLVVVGLVRLPWQRDEGGFAHLWLAQEAAALLLTAALIAVAWAWRLRPTWDGAARLAFAWIVLDVVSGLCSANPWGSVHAGSLTVCAVSVFWLSRSVGPSARWVPLPFMLAVGLGVLLEAHGVLPGLSRRGHAPGGFLGERNLAAEVLVIGVPLLATLVARAHGLLRVVSTTILALQLGAILLCRTRSAWLSLLVVAGLGFSLVVHRMIIEREGASTRTVMRAAGWIAVAAIVGALTANVLSNNVRWASRCPLASTARTLVDTDTASARGRLVQYQATLRMAVANPVLGVGPGNWSGQYLAYAHADDPTLSAAPWPVNRLPSSDLLGCTAERGALGAILLVLGAAHLWRGSDRERWLRRATLLGLLPVCALDAVLTTAPGALVAAWLLGAACPTARPQAVETVGHRSGHSRELVVGLLAVLLLVCALFAAGRVEGHRRFLHAGGLEELETSTRFDPGDIARLLFVADVLVESGRCDRAVPLLRTARRRAVETRAGRALLERCGEPGNGRL